MKYVPLTMKELESKEATNGLKAVSTFSGAGGSCMGLKLAGFEVLWANEFIPAAQDTYELNHHNTYLEKKDIRQVNAKDILNICGLDKGELDLFEGSPPCSSFSTAGSGKKKWGLVKHYSDTQQRCDDLFIEYARILKTLQPKMFISENVPALANSRNKMMFNTIYTHLKKCGYNVSAYILNSKDYGVPQKRKRLFFMGTREDLPIKPSPPKSLKTNITVQEAIPYYNKCPHEELNINKKTKTYLLLKHAQKKGYTKLAEANLDIFNSGSMYTQYVIQSNQLSPTIMASPNYYHSHFPRRVSIDEVKRIQTFPDDFKLTNKYEKQWERVGRSVPPRMMEQIALKITNLIQEVN